MKRSFRAVPNVECSNDVTHFDLVVFVVPCSFCPVLEGQAYRELRYAQCSDATLIIQLVTFVVAAAAPPLRFGFELLFFLLVVF
jgi:hypothetical protein